jgi:hypothetical protein
MPKFQIDLDDVTYEALAALALEELRQIPQQAAWVIIQAMRERAEKRQAEAYCQRSLNAVPCPEEL